MRRIEQRLHLSASKYWDTHYVFGRHSSHSVKKMGKQAVQHLIINTLIPYLRATDRIDQRKHAKNSKKEILFEMRAESNQIIKNWIKFGVKPTNAFESQALIQLYKVYCMQERCKQCQIGKTIGESIVGIRDSCT